MSIVIALALVACGLGLAAVMSGESEALQGEINGVLNRPEEEL